MARRKTEDWGIRKLAKLGGKSIGLTLPIELVRELGWKEKQRMTVKRVRGIIGLGLEEIDKDKRVFTRSKSEFFVNSCHLIRLLLGATMKAILSVTCI